MTNEEIFNENVNIAYKIANHYLINYSEEIEDIRQIALMELWRCIETWDHIHALTTYAYLCIPCKIDMYLRQVKKHNKHDISLYTVLANDDKNDVVTIVDILPDKHDYIEDTISKNNIKNILDKIYFTDKEKELIEYKKLGLTQKDIGKNMNLSQPQISRMQGHIKDKLERRMYA